jgi:hypothetical protein
MVAQRDVPPPVWGASAWRLLHAVASCVVSRADVAHARGLFLALQTLLPCARCRAAYVEHLWQRPFPRAAAGVARWVFDLHAQVNGRLGKVGPAWEEVRRRVACPASFVATRPQAFVGALVASHPGAYGEPAPALLAAHTAAWTALRHFFPDAPAVPLGAVRSRSGLRKAVSVRANVPPVGVETTCEAACSLP